jgi:MFS family permease
LSTSQRIADAVPTVGPPERAMPRRMPVALLIGTLGWNIPVSASTSVLLPVILADLAPHDKVRALALLTTIAAVTGLLANVIGGALSDLTRSRWGARTPWIVGGATAAALLLLAVPHVHALSGLIVLWCLVMVAINLSISAMTAIVPDRVPAERRASVSAVLGIGILFGSALGALLSVPFVKHPQVGFAVLAAVALLFPLITVALIPDRTAPADRVPVTAAGFARSLEPPRRAPDFYWALGGRLLIVFGYLMVQTFQLYLFTDYIGLSEAKAAKSIAVTSILFLAAALVGTLIAGPLSDRTGRRKPFVIAGSLLAVLATVPPALHPQVSSMIAFSIIGGLAFGSYYSVDTALMIEVLPSATSRGKDLGILNIANSGAQLIAPAASSAVIGIGLGFAPLFVASMVACAVGTVSILPIRGVR